MSKNIYEMTKDLIKENKFLSLATIDNDGNLWTTPLSYSYDNEYNFYFTSELDSQHIINIIDNPNVSFTIFDSTKRVSDVDGLQIRGIVGEVDKEKCVGCKMCIGVGCPAIMMKDGKSEIITSQCKGCTVCAQVCPVDAISRK